MTTKTLKTTKSVRKSKAKESAFTIDPELSNLDTKKLGRTKREQFDKMIGNHSNIIEK